MELSQETEVALVLFSPQPEAVELKWSHSAEPDHMSHQMKKQN